MIILPPLMPDKKNPLPNPIPDAVVDAVRTILPTLHTQLNQARLNSLQVRQAAIKAMNQSIRAGLDADKQFFELAQSALPIFYKQTSRTRLGLLEIHEAWITSLNQAMEQSMKTDQQLYEACLELLNNEVQEEVAVEDTEAEVEVEVVPDEEFVEEETAEN